MTCLEVIIEPKIFWHLFDTKLLLSSLVVGFVDRIKKVYLLFNPFSLPFSNFSLFHSLLPLLVCFITCLKRPFLMALDGRPRETQGRRDSKSRQSNTMSEDYAASLSLIASSRIHESRASRTKEKNNVGSAISICCHVRP